jgi:hypothetical protein
MFLLFVNSPASGALIGAYPCMFQFNWRVCGQSIAHLLVSEKYQGNLSCMQYTCPLNLHEGGKKNACSR